MPPGVTPGVTLSVKDATWRHSGVTTGVKDATGVKAWRHGVTASKMPPGVTVGVKDWRHGVKAGVIFATGVKVWRHGVMTSWRHTGVIGNLVRAELL